MADYYGFKFYSKDWATSIDVRSMSLSGKGAYISLLAYQSIAENCDLPDDDKKLAKLCDCTLEEWLEVKADVMECFIVENGRIFNPRLRDERASIDSIIARNVVAGKISAAKRAEKATGVERALNGRSNFVEPSSNHKRRREECRKAGFSFSRDERFKS